MDPSGGYLLQSVVFLASAVLAVVFSHRLGLGSVAGYLLAGVAIGLLAPEFAIKLKPLGDAFIKLIKMIIPVLVFCVVVHGIAETNAHQFRANRAGQLLDSHDGRPQIVKTEEPVVLRASMSWCACTASCNAYR